MKRFKFVKIALAIFSLHLFSPIFLTAAAENDVYLKAKENVLGINEFDLSCDINEDGKMNVFDVLRIKQELLSDSERSKSVTDPKDINVKLDESTFESASVSEQVDETNTPVDFIKLDISVLEKQGTVQTNKSMLGYNVATCLPLIADGEDIIVTLSRSYLLEMGINEFSFTKGTSPQAYITYTENVIAYNYDLPVSGYLSVSCLFDDIAISINKDYPYLLVKGNINNTTAPKDVEHHSDKDNLKTETISDISSVNVGIGIFNSIGVIGDSYTAGAVVLDDSTWSGVGQRTWLSQMCRRNGVNYANYGLGGASTKSYINDKLPDVLSGAEQSVYIMALGINDAWSLGLDYIGGESDINDDYLINPDTFYGNYARIIEQTQAKFPNAKMIMLGLQVATTNHEEYNAAIKVIAEHYNIPFINPADDRYFTDPIYTNMVGGHPTLLGYSCASYGIERLINDCINNNVDYFKYTDTHS